MNITPKAVNRIRHLLTKDNINLVEGGLRLGIIGGGCSGLSYKFQIDNHPKINDNILTFENIRVFIDPKSFIYLSELNLDYEETLMRQGFSFSNPAANKSCSCGTSFSV